MIFSPFLLKQRRGLSGSKSFSTLLKDEELLEMKRMIAAQQDTLIQILKRLEMGNKKSDSDSTARSDEVKIKPVDYVKPNAKFLTRNVRAFQDFKRVAEPYRPPRFRLRDWAEISPDNHPVEALKLQANRCMDCGTPFCQTHTGCPINNLIPEWNTLALQDQWEEAYKRLAKTNNFPEFTGRVCPAPCEGACVAGIYSPKEAVTIKNIEYKIVATAFKNGWIQPRVVKERTGQKVAVIGSGPAGLACADQLNQMGHSVTVFERAPVVGGLMHFGIPNMKIDKSQVKRRVDLLKSEGVEFLVNANVGVNVKAADIEKSFDVVCLTVGATIPRKLPVPGANLKGVHFAMDFLTASQNALDQGLNENSLISAEGKNVVVIGGGDTGTDCIATSLRQYCKSLLNLELLKKSPNDRNDSSNYWPLYPKIYKLDYGHEESKVVFGDDPRKFSIKTTELVGNGDDEVVGVKTVRVHLDGKVIEGSEKVFPADLVLLALGFEGPDPKILNAFDVKKSEPKFTTTKSNVFMAGDSRRGQSLVVWAIHEGREAADVIDMQLRKSEIQGQTLQGTA